MAVAYKCPPAALPQSERLAAVPQVRTEGGVETKPAWARKMATEKYVEKAVPKFAGSQLSRVRAREIDGRRWQRKQKGGGRWFATVQNDLAVRGGGIYLYSPNRSCASRPQVGGPSLLIWEP